MTVGSCASCTATAAAAYTRPPAEIQQPAAQKPAPTASTFTPDPAKILDVLA